MKSQPCNILVTGGTGFVGHHLVEHLLNSTSAAITIIDRLDVSGNLNRLSEIGCPHPRVRFIYHDLRSPFNGLLSRQVGEQDYIVHMAAATHVDRSISDPMDFVMNNVVATCNVLQLAQHVCSKKFLYFSTDEVFGPAPPGVNYKEDDRYRAGNPYAATKAGAEELAVAFENTYNLPVIVTHSMNIFGERQHPEKFIPMTISNVLAAKTVTIHADKTRTRAGSRFYTYAGDVASAVLFLLENGVSGEKYNIVGKKEVDNLELARAIAKVVGKPLVFEMVDFHSSRPGHDLRYALDGSKIAAMGWEPKHSFTASIEKTVRWSLENSHWLM